MNNWKWPDARGWIGIAAFILTMVVFAILVWGPTRLVEDEFFKTLATAVVITGFLNGPVSWAYASTQQGGELAKKNADIVQESATAGVVAAAVVAEKAAAALPAAGQPQEVIVKNTEAEPAIVTDAHAVDDAAGLPEGLK